MLTCAAIQLNVEATRDSHGSLPGQDIMTKESESYLEVLLDKEAQLQKQIGLVTALETEILRRRNCEDGLRTELKKSEAGEIVAL